MFGYAYWNTRNAVQNSYVPVAHTNMSRAVLNWRFGRADVFLDFNHQAILL